MARKQSRGFPWLLVGAGILLWSQRYRLMQNRFSKSPRGWALVTGASSGIGAAFARELAARGYNLILVARRADRLNALVEELRARFGIEAETLPADLTREEDLRRVVDAVSNRSDLDLLINNAGFGEPGPFAQSNAERQLDMIRLHDLASVALTRATLAAMITNGHGGIINTSSTAAFFPLYGNANYSASKAYLNNFSESVQTEIAGTGVFIQALCPGFTYSEFHDEIADFRRETLPGFMWMQAGVVVKQSLNSLGSGEVIFVPGWLNRVIAFFGRSLITSTISKEAAKIFLRNWRHV
jgi:uncharacterized protein